MKEVKFMGKHILFVLGSVVIVGILAVVLFFVALFIGLGEGEFAFPVDSKVRVSMKDMASFLEYTLADFDESELTGIESPKRKKLFYSPDRKEYGLSKTGQVPEIFIASIDGIKDHHLEHYKLLFSEAVIDEKSYIMAGRIMSNGNGNAFQGYITARDYFLQKAPSWMVSGAKKSPLKSQLEFYKSDGMNFYLHDKTSDEYILLHGNGENNPGLKTKKSRYYELTETFSLIRDLEIVATYNRSYSKEFGSNIRDLLIFEIGILLMMNFIYFKRNRIKTQKETKE
jgi:hypothetical protein